jgi:hypothetical protein
VEEKNKQKGTRGRRCGFPRRSFTYAHHIPERRKGNDRRRSQDFDLELKNQPLSESDEEISLENLAMPKD